MLICENDGSAIVICDVGDTPTCSKAPGISEGMTRDRERRRLAAGSVGENLGNVGTRVRHLDGDLTGDENARRRG